MRAISGATYMLTQDEELFSKELPPAVEDLLAESKDPLADRSDRSESLSEVALPLHGNALGVVHSGLRCRHWARV